MNDAIRLEIELKGLGSAGPDTESRLRRAILGYYRENPYLVPPPAVRSGDDDDSPYDSPCRPSSPPSSPPPRCSARRPNRSMCTSQRGKGASGGTVRKCGLTRVVE